MSMVSLLHHNGKKAPVALETAGAQTVDD